MDYRLNHLDQLESESIYIFREVLEDTYNTRLNGHGRMTVFKPSHLN
jgi:hypothetical protein